MTANQNKPKLDNINRKKLPLLTQEEEIYLISKMQAGDVEARNILIERHLRLVKSIANKNRYKGIEVEDLIQEGIIGFMTALEKYDPTKEIKLSTYATYWIRAAMLRAIENKGRAVRLPVYVNQELSKYIQAQIKLEKKYRREPTIEEIAKEMKMPIKKIEEIIKWSKVPASINKQFDPEDKDSDEFENYIICNDKEFERLEEKIFTDEIADLLENSNLTDREKDILRLRCGFNNNPMTLEEIGEIYKTSKQNIGRIENVALNKLRLSKNIDSFAVYMDYPEQSLKKIRKVRREYSNKPNLEKLKVKIDKKKESAEQMNEEKGKKSRRDGSNIYHYFYEYSEDEINNAIKQLPAKYIDIIYQRYGNDLKNPIINKNINTNLFYSRVLPKLKSILQNSQTISSNQEEDNEKDYNEPFEESTSKEESINILEIINISSFIEIAKSKPLLENTILSLIIIGYQNGKNFKNEEIADFLGIPQDKVIKTIKQALIEYKEQINKLLDITLNQIKEDEKTFTKKRKNNI